MGNSFFNTISFEGKELEKENARCLHQEKLVLAIFKANPEKKLSPNQIHYIFNRKYHLSPPLTSIRRSITNLTGKLELIKTDTMVQGEYHLPTHTWQLSSQQNNIHKNGTETLR